MIENLHTCPYPTHKSYILHNSTREWYRWQVVLSWVHEQNIWVDCRICAFLASPVTFFFDEGFNWREKKTIDELSPAFHYKCRLQIIKGNSIDFHSVSHYMNSMLIAHVYATCLWIWIYQVRISIGPVLRSIQHAKHDSSRRAPQYS